MKHVRMMFCCAIVPLIFRCFIDFGYLHGCSLFVSSDLASMMV